MNGKDLSRRRFLQRVAETSSAVLVASYFLSCEKGKEHPNILWITSEDNSPQFLGCYDGSYATTPNLDRLASEGVLFENAFATAPVCAPTRSSIISGMYPPSMGTQHMRSKYPIPEFIKFYPQFLREAGYYCTNNSKKDYNMPEPQGDWDESSKKATYKNRAEGQPFFAIFNLTSSHEHTIHKSLKNLQHDPAKVKLPPYHPDTPEMRHDWAQYYDMVTKMDMQVGQILHELQLAGLAEDTIVFYYSDHGGVLPRSKRFCYDSGLHVPMIIRFPEKYQHLAPAKPGTRTDRLVSFVDLAPTLLSLTGVKIPKYLQGKAFLGKHQAKPREYVYSFRGRMDERYDMVRTIRDKRYRYIRNFMPHRIYGQHIWYLWKAPSMRSWERAYKEGKCNEIQSIFWHQKPEEELYDIASDPYEVHNLADNPEYRQTLLRMRQACREWIMEIRDTGFIPEGLMVEWSKERTLWDVTHSPEYPMERIVETAYMATDRDPGHLPRLVERMEDEHPVIRYWATTGCLVLGKKARSAIDSLKKRLSDEVHDTRVTAAEALCVMGEVDVGLPVLIKALADENSKVVLHAANSLECLGDVARPALDALKAALNNPDHYVQRAVEYTISHLS